MGHAPRALLAGGLGFAVSFVVACGGGAGLLSGGQSSTLEAQLNSVSSAVGAGQCEAAASAVNGLRNAVVNLPPSLNNTLRSNLAQGASTVGQLAARDCHPTTTTTRSTTTASTTTTRATSTTPSTSSTSPSSSTTTPTSTTTPATSSTTPGTSTNTRGSGGAGLGGGGGGSGNGNGGNGP